MVLKVTELYEINKRGSFHGLPEKNTMLVKKFAGYRDGISCFPAGRTAIVRTASSEVFPSIDR